MSIYFYTGAFAAAVYERMIDSSYPDRFIKIDDDGSLSLHRRGAWDTKIICAYDESPAATVDEVIVSILGRSDASFMKDQIIERIESCQKLTASERNAAIAFYDAGDLSAQVVNDAAGTYTRATRKEFIDSLTAVHGFVRGNEWVLVQSKAPRWDRSVS